MKLRTISIVSFLLLAPCVGTAQTVWESSSGESSVYLKDAGLLSINFSDANVKTALVRQISTSRIRLGAEFKVKSTEGFTSLFEEKEFALPEASGRLFMGRVSEPPDSQIRFLLYGLQVEYTRGFYKLASVDENGLINLQDKNFDGITGTVLLNAFVDNFILPGEFLWGISLSYGKRNNLNQLKKVDVRKTIASDTNDYAIQDSRSGRMGQYEETDDIKLNLDIIWYQKWIKNRFALGLLGRYDGTKDKKPFVPGMGIYFLKEGAPLNLQGGLTLEWIDDDVRLGLQTGYAF